MQTLLPAFSPQGNRAYIYCLITFKELPLHYVQKVEDVFEQHGNGFPKVDKLSYLEKKVRVDLNIALQVVAHAPLVVVPTTVSWCVAFSQLFAPRAS